MPGANRKKYTEAKISPFNKKKNNINKNNNNNSSNKLTLVQLLAKTMAQNVSSLSSSPASSSSSSSSLDSSSPTKKSDSRPELLRKMLKREQRETPPRLMPAVDGPADDAANASSDNFDSSNTKIKCNVVLPRGGDDSEMLDRKDEIQRLISKDKEQDMPQLDNECQNAACGQDNGTDPESVAASSVYSDDTPPRLTAAQVNSSLLSNVVDEGESRGEYCNDNTSPPPLDKYASSTAPPTSASRVTRDSSVWSLRLRRRPLTSALLNVSSETGPSVNKRNCTEMDWVNKLADVLGELNPNQLALAKETVYSTMVKVLAQEITSEISCLMNLIEGQDRRAIAFERILKDLKKLKSDFVCDSNL